MERLRVKRQTSPTKGRLLSALLTYMPGAWFSPSQNELVAVYRQRYRMALEEEKYDTALIFVRITPNVALLCLAIAVPLGAVATVVASWALLRRGALRLAKR